MSILKYLFQSDLVFPMDPVEKQLAQEEWAQIRAYLEGLEEFHDRERRLTYENGFLLAVSLCLELSGQLERMR